MQRRSWDAKRANILIVLVVAIIMTLAIAWIYARPGGLPDGHASPPPPLPSATPTGATPSPAPSSEFELVDQATSRLLQRDARWHAPDVLDVGETYRIGLSIGSGSTLNSRIRDLLPQTRPKNAGPVEVGPTMRASLLADSDDATVKPLDAINASTGTDVQILWTWFVHPLHPTEELLLTAHLELPLTERPVIQRDISLTVSVRRTLSYTTQQIFTNWATWSAILTVALSVGGLIYRRRRKAANQRSHSPSNRNTRFP
jgi:hypothetical protein